MAVNHIKTVRSRYYRPLFRKVILMTTYVLISAVFFLYLTVIWGYDTLSNLIFKGICGTFVMLAVSALTGILR
jgi:hypothetical protein